MKVTIKDASRMLGRSEATIREGLKVGAFEFGTAFKKEGNQKWTYVIYPEKFKACVDVERKV